MSASSPARWRPLPRRLIDAAAAKQKHFSSAVCCLVVDSRLVVVCHNLKTPKMESPSYPVGGDSDDEVGGPVGHDGDPDAVQDEDDAMDHQDQEAQNIDIRENCLKR